MNPESRTIIHFTESVDRLKGILSICFKIKYCREQIMFRDIKKILRVPVVSFCDIPIHQAQENMDKYGYYAIGLTEEWAIRQGLTPVIYLQRHSHLAESLLNTVDLVVSIESKQAIDILKKNRADGLSWEEAIRKFPEKNTSETSESDHLMDALDVLRYTKNYVGELVRANGERVAEYYFSDEREWRYALKTTRFHEFMFMEDMAENNGMLDLMQKLIESKRLTFDASDISHIMIPTESERSEIQSHIESLKDKFTEKEIAHLISKIIPVSEITR